MRASALLALKGKNSALRLLTDPSMKKAPQCGFTNVIDAHRFPGDDIPIVRGSALAALKGENPALGKEKILELMAAVDEYVPTPARALDKPFSMPVEDVFSIQVRLVGPLLQQPVYRQAQTAWL